MKELVFSNNGQIMTNSLLVAEKFQKNHRDVLSAIDELVKGSAEFSATPTETNKSSLLQMFEETTYIHPQNKQEYRMYLMNRDGFSLLVMGFTGQKALQFKLDFINAFNHYEQVAKNPVANLSKIDLAQMVIESEREKERLQLQNQLQEQELQKQAPKVAYYEEVLQSQSTYNANQIAKELGMSALTLNKKLKEMGVQYKQGGCWLLYHKHQDKGYTKTKTHTYTDSNGQTKTSMQTVWTEEGRRFIHNLFKKALQIA